jgi:hypothetical protein
VQCVVSSPPYWALRDYKLEPQICGAPWQRVVEKGLTAHDGTSETPYDQKVSTAGRLAKLRQAARERGEEYTSAKTTLGFAPTCKCVVISCISCGFVLDYGHEQTTSKTKQHLSGVRGGVPSVENHPEVLQPQMCGHEQPTQLSETENVQSVRENIQTQKPSESVLRQILFNEVDSTTQEEQQGMVQEHQGVHTNLQTSPPQCVKGGVCDATSAYNGGILDETIIGVGSGSPQERNQGRQPAGKLAANGEKKTRLKKQREMGCGVPPMQPSFSDEGECPRCKGRLKVETPRTKSCVVLDPFAGSGTVLRVAEQLGLESIGIDLNPSYKNIASKRTTITRGLCL